MSSNKVTVTPANLVVEPVGLNKMWSFKRRLRFPLEHVRGATFDPGIRDEPKGWRGPGLGLPGKLSGTFHSGGKKQFWNISGYDRAVVITLDPAEQFDRLVITVEDPHQLVDMINNAAGAR
ncbi:hypothetical protein NNX28_03930 [Arthrobacter sp. zg-Y859]|uniref:Bacterial Pleckstrin homology domain-containing protein n=1 Tax=Arthrobacter jinronghuae TaxID=2964609 RepID=A0ABT1NMZ0_9MICC|nr:hypothetical protein [Arthrobacter jinronghuae]MCQ1949078.1 hypothetical protein [Arthrobacter jinronghuae]UWX78129.1 hypothetical protein N2K98_14335 [Arthrobacter jinronghuae]